MKKNNFFICLFIFIFLQSCQSIEEFNKITFDYLQFEKLTFLANEMEIKNNYQPSFNEPYVDHLATSTPSKRFIEWVEQNVKVLGSENKLVIIIKEASITKSKFKNKEKVYGIIKKPEEIKYELNYDVLFVIYDDFEKIIGKSDVQVVRSITSEHSISLAKRDQVLEDLIYNSLKDLTFKSEESVNKFIKMYVL